MKQWLMLGALMALMCSSPMTVWAAEEFTPAQQEEIRKMFKEWQKNERMIGGRMTEIPPPTEEMPALGDTKKETVTYGGTFTGGGALQGGRTVYAKPFVKSPKTIVGGYMDFTISDCNGNTRDCSRGLEFDQERFVPFFYSQVTNYLSVAAELEIEHGGPQGNQGDGDIKMEFATMDYRVADAFNLRGGIILIPMGRFNLIHDSPLNDLPLRPMVSRLLIPSTFAESGFGFFGTVYPTQLSKVDYEFYITQGFDGDATSTSTSGTGAMGDPVTRTTTRDFTSGNGLRSIRGSFKKDNNENKAIVSRVSISPILGVEVAGSIHHGKWDDRGKNDLTITAVDGLLQRGPFEIMGEAAWVSVEGGTQTESGGTPPANMDGYYVQGNYHFMPEWLKQWAPNHFTDASTFTGIVRWGQVDTNSDISTNANQIDRLTLGLNFRPVEDSVIKFAYTWNDHHSYATLNPGKIGSASDPGAANGWQVSAATYF